MTTTAKDQVVSPSLQAIIVAATPVREEITIDRAHADPQRSARHGTGHRDGHETANDSVALNLMARW